MDKQEIAADELKLIQDLIFKQEEFCYVAYRYGFIIISGLVLALFSEKVTINLNHYFIITSFVWAGSIYLQLIYRESFFCAVRRSHKIQKFLRGDEKQYRGPSIYESVHKIRPTWPAVREALKNPRFTVPNLFLALIVIVSATLKVDGQPIITSDPQKAALFEKQ